MSREQTPEGCLFKMISEGRWLNIKHESSWGLGSRGYVLDLHTTSSVLIGYHEFGHRAIRYNVFRDWRVIESFEVPQRQVDFAAPCRSSGIFHLFLGIEFTAIVPVPPTKIYRTFQPVLAMSGEIANTLKVPFTVAVNCLPVEPDWKIISGFTGARCSTFASP